MSHTFFVELGTEELPPKALLSLSQAFHQHLASALRTAGFEVSDRGLFPQEYPRLQTPGIVVIEIKPYASARRLALLVTGLPTATPSQKITNWGPPAKVAYDTAGQLTKAGMAFAEKNGVQPSQLVTASDGKIDKICCQTQVGGEPLVSLLPAFVSAALAALPIPKRMRWGSSRNEFVRPAQWLVMLFDNQVMAAEVLGLKAGNTTRGHRFHNNRPLTISDAAQYAALLANEGYVLADFAERRAKVRAQVEAAGLKLGGVAAIDEELLDEVTALVEWPVALAGQFEERFLSVPAEALISSMKEHQKYFHVVNANGKLMPFFITVANIESKDPSQVIAGNEKVIRPRLSDAAFFFATDKQTSLENQREKLRTVMFQAQLGSLYDKTERLAKLAAFMANKIGADATLAARAGELAKSDLVSKMVYEFADMQGIAGFYYAQNDGENGEIAQAMLEQYLPKFAGDILPATTTGALLALADRLDTLVGIFGIGQIPTGSKDPFGLRRASLGALRILVEKKFDLDLRELLTFAASTFTTNPNANLKPDTVTLALNYMLERFSSWYSEAGISAEVFQAVNAKNLTTPLDINNRVYAVAAFCQLPEAQALAAANKRVANILAKLSQTPSSLIIPALLLEDAEKQLAKDVESMQAKVTPLFAAHNYNEALAVLAGLRGSVDRFFDDVMVMSDDLALRDNRLALLQQLRNLFWEVADISCLVVK